MKFFTSKSKSKSTSVAVAGLLLVGSQIANAQKSASEIILQIMPGAASCSPGATECRTADQAASHLIKAFQTYNVAHAAEIAAILATIGTESGDLTWKTNQFPGRPGQGSSNMQMYTFNYQFAQSIPDLKVKVDAIDGAGNPSPSDEVMNAVRALVIDDEYNWMTGPWYYSTKCTSAQKAAFSEEGADLDAAFSEYTLGCIGAGMEGARTTRWEAAKAAFNL